MKLCKNCEIEYEAGQFCKKCGNTLVDKDEQVLTCANCGNKLEPGVKFCPECGTKVAVQKLVCSGCGIELKPGVKFCPECGTKFDKENKEEKKEESTTVRTETSNILLDVTLAYAEKNTKEIISALESCGFDHEYAKETVNCAPLTIKENVPENEALSIKEILEKAGAEVELEYVGAEEQFIQVSLESVGSSNLQVINILHEVCKYNLTESKLIVERIPALIKEACTKYEADSIKKAFETIGCQIKFEYVHYVDLGLPSGLLWADCNVGASKPEDFGNSFEWGDINPAPQGINPKDYTHVDRLIDSNGFLIATYDAASKNWGNKWKMPTKFDFQELIYKCSWYSTRESAVWKIVSKSNGNSIFLPYGVDYWSSYSESYEEDRKVYILKNSAVDETFVSSMSSWWKYGWTTAKFIRPVLRKHARSNQK